MSTPKKQHQVPCSYLKWFWGKDFWRETEIFLYDIKTKKWRYDKIKNITVEKDLYTLEINWKKHYEIEKFMWDNIEKIWKIITKIDNKEILNENEILKISYFVAMQELRSKTRWGIEIDNDNDILHFYIRWIYEHCDNKKDRLKALKNTLKEYFSNYQFYDSYEKILNKFENNETINFSNKNNNIKNIIKKWPFIASILLSYSRIVFQVSDNNSFITSDYPIYLQEPKWFKNTPFSVGFWTADFIWIPLSKKSYLYMSYSGDSKINDHKVKNLYQNINDNKIIKMLNWCTCVGTDRFIIWENEEIVSLITDFVEKCDEEYYASNRWSDKYCRKSN